MVKFAARSLEVRTVLGCRVQSFLYSISTQTLSSVKFIVPAAGELLGENSDQYRQ